MELLHFRFSIIEYSEGLVPSIVILLENRGFHYFCSKNWEVFLHDHKVTVSYVTLI